MAPDELNSTKETDGFTGLHIAALNGKTQLVQYLLDQVLTFCYTFKVIYKGPHTILQALIVLCPRYDTCSRLGT